MITSQPHTEGPPDLAIAATNVATLGIAGALQRRDAAESAAARREYLEDLRLSDELRKLLDQQIQNVVGGHVANVEIPSEFSADLHIRYTAALTPGRSIIFLNIPASILSNGLRIRQLLMLTNILRGHIVRVFSSDLNSSPSAAFNGLKSVWVVDGIDLDFVPLSHIRDLQHGEAELGEVLNLDIQTLSAPTKYQSAVRSESSGPAQKQTQTIKVFLASSKELRDDRDDFDLHFRHKNDLLRDRGIYLQIVRWEYFLDAMSETRLQDEYNKKVRQCDVFVCLFRTKTGNFTEEEFNTAYDQFKKTGKPRIFPYFKDFSFSIDSVSKEDLDSLLEFRAKLMDLGHFPTSYENADSLKLDFEGQIESLLIESAEPNPALSAKTPNV